MMNAASPPPSDPGKSEDAARVFDILAAVTGDKTKPAVKPTGPRFQRRSLIGEGGLGRVWLAYDQQLEREVALKEMRPDKAGSVLARRRFFREARIASKLRHPAIISILDVDDDPAGQSPFFTMPVAPGGTLERSIEELYAISAGAARKRSLRRLLQIFVSVCQAIDYAHSHGVIHRDLKPANIALGEFGEVLVLDWGLARIANQSDEQDSAFDALRRSPLNMALTLEGDVLGTPAYMAPEQALGKRDAVTSRCDIYSLGAILFKILTNETPHQQQSATREEFLEMRSSRPAPSARTIVKSVPPALDAICAKALEIAPNARYSTAGELAGDIIHWLTDEPVAVYREHWSKRSARWAKRNRWTTTLLLGIAAILIVSGVTLGVSVLATYHEMLNEHVNDQTLLAGQVAARMADVAFFHRLTVHYLAEKPEVKALLQAKSEGRSVSPLEEKVLAADLRAMVESRPYWTRCSVCAPDGRELLAFQRQENGFGPVSAAPLAAADGNDIATCLRLAGTSDSESVYVSPPRLHSRGAKAKVASHYEQCYCRAVRSPANDDLIGAILVSVGIFNPERPLYRILEHRTIPSAHVYLADSAGNFLVQPEHHDDWHDDWLQRGLILRRFPELAPMFGDNGSTESMSVTQTQTRQIVTAAPSNYNPFDSSQRIVVVVVSEYDDLRTEETNTARRVWFPVAAITAAIVFAAFAGGWLATRAADA